MPHRLLACPESEAASPYPMAMTFDFSDTLPSTDWAPPDASMLYEMPMESSSKVELRLPELCTEWAETERLGL